MMRRLYLVLLLCLAMASLARAGETIDRIVAVVNGRPLMESEMVEELHLEQLLANKPAQSVPPEELRALLGRMVDQLLLAQQMDAVRFPQTPQQEVQDRITGLRKVVPSGSAEEWRSWLRAYDLSEEDVAEYVAEQLRTFRFIDARFRPTVRLEPGAVETYYKEQLVPKMRQAGAQPLPMSEVEPKIREILVQQRMNDLLETWLKSLRVQTEIRFPEPSSALVQAESLAHSHPAEVR